MSESTTNYGILVAVDGSAESDAAVRWAAREAAMHDAPVTLMHVVAPIVANWAVRSLEASFTEWQEENAQHVIEQAQKTFQAAVANSEIPAVQTEVQHASVVTALTDASEKAQMIVVGSRGRGAIGRAVLGSVSSSVLHHAHCPVAVTHAEEAQGAIVNTCGSRSFTRPPFTVVSSGRSTSLPFSKVAPARTSATRCGALTARQRGLSSLDQLVGHSDSRRP